MYSYYTQHAEIIKLAGSLSCQFYQNKDVAIDKAIVNAFLFY